MTSIKEIRRKFPKEFIDNIYYLFPPGKADSILLSMASKRMTTVRVNTIKYNIQSLMECFKAQNIKFDRVMWYKEGLIIKNADEKIIQQLSIYRQGYIYIQSLSSMIPPLILNPNGYERVLDLTAAPGSKTTQMAALMRNKGYILANELDKIRAERLKYNINLQGAANVDIKVGKGEKIGDEFPEYFDKVLLDVPCSGEGRFKINDVKTYKGWSKKEVEKLSMIQKKLFKSGYKALKQNGIIVYSTCTINTVENEEIIKWIVNNFKIKILDINLNIMDALPAFNSDHNYSLDKAIRIIPSKHMEGFFVCKMKKL